MLFQQIALFIKKRRFQNPVFLIRAHFFAFFFVLCRACQHGMNLLTWELAALIAFADSMLFCAFH